MKQKILKTMKINYIWSELELDRSVHSGLLYQRYSAEIKPDIYVSLKIPERLRCISVHLSKSYDINITNINIFRDIKLDTFNDDNNPDKVFFLIILLNNQLSDIFSTLCEDLILKVAEITDENDLVNHLVARLEAWRSLFEKLSRQGLSEEFKRGLYGELYFLRKFLLNNDNHIFCLNSWRGPEKSVQDFHYAEWAVEVKTTHGKKHQQIHISNERQLDTSFVPFIFLYHLSLEERQHHGETLNEIIEELNDILSENPVSLNTFKLKLLEANYFDIHREFYNNPGYSVRNEKLYRITENFPRITESLVPSGVGNVRYTIIVTDNTEWNIDENELFEILRESEKNA